METKLSITSARDENRNFDRELTSSAIYATLFKPNFRLEVSTSDPSFPGFLGMANLVSCISPLRILTASLVDRFRGYRERHIPSSSSAHQHGHELGSPFQVSILTRED
jgi:hypothetical protein